LREWADLVIPQTAQIAELARGTPTSPAGAALSRKGLLPGIAPGSRTPPPGPDAERVQDLPDRPIGVGGLAMCPADTFTMRESGWSRTEHFTVVRPASRVFNAFILVSALTLFAYSVFSRPEVSTAHLALTLTLALAGLITMLLATRGNRRDMATSSRFGLSIDAVWVFAAVLLLPFPFMILSTALARWLSALVNRPMVGRGAKTQLVSYISTTAVSGFVASVVHQSIGQHPTPGMDSDTREVVAVLVSAVVFSLISHLLTGVAYTLARSQRLRDQQAVSGILIEVALLCHGGLAAWAWTQSPAIFFLGLPTLVLVQRALLHERLEERANRDAKTGVGSIGWWREAANHEVEQARPHRRVGFLVIDLDNFKKVNDTHGHLNGDIVLKAVADVLKSEVRSGDKVGRFGGEEFVVLLPGASPAVVQMVAERLRAGVEQLVITLDGPIVGITVSIGGAVYPVDGETVTDVMQYADMNLYRAKRQGRNQVDMGDRPRDPAISHTLP
jgi:diguanylate cyclase (GGDEF)-like protein